MTMQRAVLELSADVDEDNVRETAEFHMVGNVNINPRVEIDHLVASGSTATSVVTSRSGEATTKRAPYHLDLGAGSRIVEVDFLGWEGATDAGGDPVQWGVRNGGIYDATGANPLTQIDLLIEFLARGEYDSRARNAKLRYGEHSGGTNTAGEAYPDGAFSDYLHVVPLSASPVRDYEKPKSYNGSIILQETFAMDKPVDAVKKAEWG